MMRVAHLRMHYYFASYLDGRWPAAGSDGERAGMTPLARSAYGSGNLGFKAPAEVVIGKCRIESEPEVVVLIHDKGGMLESDRPESIK